MFLRSLSDHHSLTIHDTGEMLASAGDDGVILLWVPAENAALHANTMGDDALEDRETWRTKTMCRSTGSEIYDLAWSPDGVYFITGSMDNVARIYNAQTGMRHNKQSSTPQSD
jgi:chromatin assembly factor 1 subunit B